jgi:hypothetical protein
VKETDMAEAGDIAVGTPAETLAGLRANPTLMTCTQFPTAGYDYYVSYVPETDTYVDRVVLAGHDVEDEEAVVVAGSDFTEEEILSHFGFLQQKEEAAKNPLAFLMQMLAGGVEIE